MIELAIYDMDRTITRTGTYTPFLLHAASRLAPWRLLLAPGVAVAMLGYAARVIDRKRLEGDQPGAVARAFDRARSAGAGDRIVRRSRDGV
jgi:hypothetical protein